MIYCLFYSSYLSIILTFKNIILRDTEDDKTLMPYESNEESQEYINKQVDQADKRVQRDKWFAIAH